MISADATQGYRDAAPHVWGALSLSACCMCSCVRAWLSPSRCFFMYSMSAPRAHIRLHTFVCTAPWEFHWWIDLLSPIILCFADGMCKPPPCLCAPFFLSLCIGRLGNRRSSFEPITQPDPLIITNLPESLIWGLPNSAPCVQCGFSSLSCLGFCLFLFFFDAGAREGSQKRRRRIERGKGGWERDCLHTFAHLSLGILHQSENKTSLWAGQYSGNTVNNS